MESPGAGQPHVVEGTPRDCLEKSVTMTVGKTRGTQTLEDAFPEAVAWPLNAKGLAENHTVEAMDPEARMNSEIMRLLDAEDHANAEKRSKEQEGAAIAKEKADAEARARADVAEKARKKQDEATRARVNADAAKKAAKKERKTLREAAKRANTSKDK